jgi:hypothetical protein
MLCHQRGEQLQAWAGPSRGQPGQRTARLQHRTAQGGPPSPPRSPRPAAPGAVEGQRAPGQGKRHYGPTKIRLTKSSLFTELHGNLEQVDSAS